MKDIVYTNALADLSGMAKKQYNFRFDEKLMEQIQKLADKDNRTATNYIETLLKKAVEEDKKKSKKD
jgi:hypothetical protein